MGACAAKILPDVSPEQAIVPAASEPRGAREAREELADHARYFKIAALRKLLTFDRKRGGIPIRVIRARWMLEWFCEPRRKLPTRQELEEKYPEAFADEAMVERLLAEVEEALKDPAKMYFPGLAAISYCWLDPDHPDPAARTMRERWLPVLE